MLKLLGGAVAVAALPIPIPEIEPELKPEFYADSDSAFVVMPAPHDVTAYHFVMWKGRPLGIAMDSARKGRRVLIQVYGQTRVAIVQPSLLHRNPTWRLSS